ncbi:MAG: WS/DGAT domain-containing protein [Frankiaceae bacterium]
MSRPIGPYPSSRMPAADRIWLGLDSPRNVMVVTAVLELADPIDEAALRTVLADRLLAGYPRFGQRVVPGRWPLRAPRWRDAEVDLDVHLQRLSTDDGLPAVVQGLLSQPLDLARPPWQCHLVTARTGDALVIRLHHCIADGIALASVLLALTDEAPHSPGQQPVDARTPRPPIITAARQGAGTAWSGLRLLTLPSEPALPLTGARDAGKRAAWTSGMPFPEVRAVAAATGSSVNDVLLAVTAGALRRYLAAAGQRPEDLRVYVPVNVRSAASSRQLGNRLGLLFPRLPVAQADPLARVAAISRRMTVLKAGSEAAATAGLIRLLGMLPNWAHALAGRVLGAKGTAVVTNVPGPRRPVHLAGAEVSRLTFWIPQIGSIGIGISIFSYAGTVSIGVATDADLVPDPARLTAAMDAEFTELRLATQ